LTGLGFVPGPAAAHELGAHYEALRSWALERPRPRCAPSGASVLFGRGLAEWLQTDHGAARAQADAPAAPQSAHPPPLMGEAQNAGALVRVLATMVTYCQQEGPK
jgi:hypothetical protein